MQMYRVMKRGNRLSIVDKTNGIYKMKYELPFYIGSLTVWSSEA